MATLKGQKIQDSYKTLLKTVSTSGFSSSTPTVLEDGDGNQSALSIGRAQANVVGSLSLNLGTTATPAANLHVVGTATSAILVQNNTGYKKFYVGDSNGPYNSKMGDISSTSSGNNTYFYVQDSANRISSKSTYFGVNQAIPTATLHVGGNSGTALFQLGTSTDAFKVTSSSNTTLFVADTTNDKVVVNGDIEMTGTGALRRSHDRYYLEEFFKRLPAANADILDTSEGTRMIANPDFELLGTRASTGDVTFSSTYAGIELQTDGNDNDQVIIAPHLDASQTSWTGIKWGTENQTEWECAITTDNSIATYSFWAGLKLTNAPAYATDADQAYFLFCTDDDHGALTTNANLHFVYSNDNTDYITDLGIAVAASTTYKLRISIDSGRQVSVFVNGVQYGLTSATTAGGVVQSAATTKSLALADDHDFIPYIGVQQMAGSKTSELIVHYEKISRILFE